MTLYSGPFNGLDRAWRAEDFARYHALFIGNGVFPNPSTGLQVIQGENMQTIIRPGYCWINGYYLWNTYDYVIQHDNADGVLKRIDRIVARWDIALRDIIIDVKKGTFASSPTAPAVQRDAAVFELVLADVLINNGTVQITQANITDTRLNSELCGIVHGLVNQVDTTTIFNQYKDWFENWTTVQEEEFEAWMATLNDILDGDVAGNLANRIFGLEQSVENLTTNTIPTLQTTVNNHAKDYVKHPGYATTSGTNNYSVTLNPVPTALAIGMGVVIRVGNDATGNCTLNVNGLGAKNILKTDGSAVNDLKANAIYTLRYNGTAFILQGESGVNIDKDVGDSFVEVSTGVHLSFNESIALKGVSNNYLYLTSGTPTTIHIHSKATNKRVKTIDLASLNLGTIIQKILYFPVYSRIAVIVTNNAGNGPSILIYDELFTNLITSYTYDTSTYIFSAEKNMNSRYLFVYSGGNSNSTVSRLHKFDIGTVPLSPVATWTDNIYVNNNTLKMAIDKNDNIYLRKSSNSDFKIYKFNNNLSLIATINHTNNNNQAMYVTDRYLYAGNILYDVVSNAVVKSDFTYTINGQCGQCLFLERNFTNEQGVSVFGLFVLDPEGDGFTLSGDKMMPRDYNITGSTFLIDDNETTKYPSLYTFKEAGTYSNNVSLLKYLGGKLR